jgi:hypothetical protein
MTKEVKTVQEYYIFLKDFPDFVKSDVNILNFVMSLKNINRGCSCKKKTRMKLCLFNLKKMTENISEGFEKSIVDFYSKTKYKEIRLYLEKAIVKTVKIDE